MLDTSLPHILLLSLAFYFPALERLLPRLELERDFGASTGPRPGGADAHAHVAQGALVPRAGRQPECRGAEPRPTAE